MFWCFEWDLVWLFGMTWVYNLSGNCLAGSRNFSNLTTRSSPQLLFLGSPAVKRRSASVRKLLMCKIIMSFAEGNHHSCIRESRWSWSSDGKKTGAPVNLRMKIDGNHYQVLRSISATSSQTRGRSDLRPCQGVPPKGLSRAHGPSKLERWRATHARALTGNLPEHCLQDCFFVSLQGRVPVEDAGFAVRNTRQILSSQGHQVYVAGFKRQEKILKCLVQRWISTNRLHYNSQGKTQKYSRICCGAIDGCFKLEQSCKRFQIDSKQNFQRGFEISNIFAYYRATYLHPALPHGNAQFSCMYYPQI